MEGSGRSGAGTQLIEVEAGISWGKKKDRLEGYLGVEWPELASHLVFEYSVSALLRSPFLLPGLTFPRLFTELFPSHSSG